MFADDLTIWKTGNNVDYLASNISQFVTESLIPWLTSHNIVESSRCGNDDVVCQPTDGNRSDPPARRSTTASYAEVARRGCGAEQQQQMDKLTCLDKQK